MECIDLFKSFEVFTVIYKIVRFMEDFYDFSSTTSIQ